MAGALIKAGKHVQEGLDKIRDKTWAEPLGKGLAIGGQIVTGMGNLVPGIGILGGAMAFGASLLNPEPTIADLQLELKEIKLEISDPSQSKTVLRALQRQQKDLEEKIENPLGEIKSNFEEIKTDMKKIFKSIEEESLGFSDDVSKLKDVISQTFLLVADVKYRDGIDKIDAAYEVFITEASTGQFDDFKQYVFELKTIATQNLAPKRIMEYMKIIYSDGGGIPMCQSVMDYIVIVISKYLQMMVAYAIFKEDSERVTSQFELFNEQYSSFVDIFKKVTNLVYKPGSEIVHQKPIAKVSPMSDGRPHKKSDASNRELESFLLKYGLVMLGETFQKKNINFEDVLDMDKDEMEEVGITSYKHRKLLWRAIQNHTAEGSNSEGNGRSLPVRQVDEVDSQFHSEGEAQWHSLGATRHVQHQLEQGLPTAILTNEDVQIQQWQGAEPDKTEFLVECSGWYIDADEKIIGVGTQDGQAVLLNAYTGEKFWDIRCTEKSSKLFKRKKSESIQLTMSEDVVTTVSNTGTVTVWDRLTRELLYREAHHGDNEICAVAAVGDVTITAGVDGSLAVMTLSNTKPRVKLDCLTRSLIRARITHIDCDNEHLMVGTDEGMTMIDITNRKYPKKMTSVEAGHVYCCVMFYPFAACTGEFSLQVWDMEKGVKVRHLLRSRLMYDMRRQDNVLAVSEADSPEIYLYDLKQLCMQEGELWTRKIRSTEDITTIAINKNCLFAVTQMEAMCKISVWNFRKYSI